MAVEAMLPSFKQSIDMETKVNNMHIQLAEGFQYDDVDFLNLSTGRDVLAKYGNENVFQNFIKLYDARKKWISNKPSPIAEKIKNMAQHASCLSTINKFIITWLMGKESRFQADVRRLETDLQTPGLGFRGPAEVPESKAASEVEDPAEPALASDDSEPSDSEPSEEGLAAARESKEQRARTAWRASRKRFNEDEFYRFVDCSTKPKPLTSALPVANSVAKIREEVERQSMALTSSKVVCLIKALEPYGAKCEGNRKKGIMIKLPSSRPGVPYVAKFIHRNHESIDPNTVEALKNLFDASIFTIDKFRATGQ
jgi:hypothetical protein